MQRAQRMQAEAKRGVSMHKSNKEKRAEALPNGPSQSRVHRVNHKSITSETPSEGMSSRHTGSRFLKVICKQTYHRRNKNIPGMRKTLSLNVLMVWRSSF